MVLMIRRVLFLVSRNVTPRMMAAVCAAPLGKVGEFRQMTPREGSSWQGRGRLKKAFRVTFTVELRRKR